ncbi:PASTA domain-containing protein [Thermus thermamylovorans]|uniref:PASTA domain-containing protein n=1 Tax=Thermus thermamylovorans TaxID=2509362 RepID=A0A4Q9B8D7_9DEIN|nr:PASTA domain-containing protein [Thermus thermamylovorans]TBH21138.1 PASTA domain-containing protein [Thermus thermamylovorans]
MLLDDRYPVLETLEAREGVTLYRVEGGWVFLFQVRTPEEKERFHRYRTALKRLMDLGLVEAQVSAKPGRYYAFFPERPPVRKPPPKEALEALAPFGFGQEHLAMAEGGVAYLAPWSLGREAPPGRAFRPPARFLLGVAPGLLLVALGLWLLFQGLYRYFNPPEYAVPELVGKTAREAFLLLKDTGLQLEVVEGNDPAKPREVVLEQSPPPGTRLREGRTVRLVLNQARLNPLPDLAGLRQEEAEGRLAELGYRLAGTARVESPEPLGTVLATDPPPGTPLAPGAGVRLLLSQGAPAGPTVPLPQLTGLSREEALFLVNAAGLQAQVEEVPAGAPPGTVLAQEPPPGTPMPPGGGVRLRVAVQGEVLLPPAPPRLPEPTERALPFALHLPPEAEGRQVRLSLLDARGEHVLYEGEGQAGLRLEGTYRVQGEARFRLYLDGEPFQEWTP